MDNNFAFGLKGIEIINSVIKAPAERRKLTGFTFDMRFRTNANIKESMVDVFVDVLIKDQEINDQVGQYSAVFQFSVDDLDKVVSGNELNQVEIPQPLLNTLFGISTSTLRGLMFSTFKGTFLHGAMLPLIDIGALQPELTPLSN